MRRHLAPKGVRVHNLSFVDPNPIHIDASLLLARPGLAITNPERPCLQAEIFKKSGWDVITMEHTTSIPKGRIMASHSVYFAKISTSNFKIVQK